MMTLIIYLTLTFIGLMAGMLGGLLGIGGGIITVPAFLFVFHIFAFPSPYNIQMAIGTSLGVMIFTSLSSTWAHYKKKGIKWDFLRYYSPGVVCGAILGVLIADSLPSRQLLILFSGYIFCFGFYFAVSSLKKKEPYLLASKLKDPYPLTTTTVGFLAGTFSSILGVGGAPITIPFLTAHRVELKHAISTSAFVSLLVGLTGSLSYLFFGLNEHLSNGNIGYLYIPGIIFTGVASFFSAPLGANLVYKLPTRILRAIFGIFLIIVSIILITR